jgi:hypothetical protein
LVITRATGRNIPEDAILHSHRRENFKSYRVSLLSLLKALFPLLFHETFLSYGIEEGSFIRLNYNIGK